MQCLLLLSLTWTIPLLQEFPYKQATIEVNTQNLLGDIYSTHAQHLRKALTLKKKIHSLHMESVSGYLSLVKTVNSLPVNKIHLPAAIRRISYSKSV